MDRLYDAKNLILVDIFYNSLQLQLYEESEVEVWEVLADVGGTMGLYLGATIVTIIEIMFFCCEGHGKNKKTGTDEMSKEEFQEQLNHLTKQFLRLEQEAKSKESNMKIDRRSRE